MVWVWVGDSIIRNRIFGYIFCSFFKSETISEDSSIFVDYLVSLIPRDSFLKLTHSLARLPLYIAIWGLGAAVVSFFGVAFHILETTLQAAVVAGIAWPVLMTRIVSSAGAAAEPEETGEAEETEE